jgi:hypothetical protein
LPAAWRQGRLCLDGATGQFERQEAPQAGFSRSIVGSRGGNPTRNAVGEGFPIFILLSSVSMAMLDSALPWNPGNTWLRGVVLERQNAVPRDILQCRASRRGMTTDLRPLRQVAQNDLTKRVAIARAIRAGGEEVGQPAPAEDGEPEIGQVRCQGDKTAAAIPRLGPSETNSLWLGREAPPVGGVEEGPAAQLMMLGFADFQGTRTAKRKS